MIRQPLGFHAAEIFCYPHRPLAVFFEYVSIAIEVDLSTSTFKIVKHREGIISHGEDLLFAVGRMKRLSFGEWFAVAYLVLGLLAGSVV